ncbi:MAG: OB-fold domain-containing protein [Delftia acidovorans]|uniref:Zn-ribbon domain-containing OB-fold protein n=1 Tax=Delftia sp. UME58 TaxID=1862322 RepID=UPI001602EF3C|nr:MULTISPECIES: OB-fold domain-containing protein [Delftia]MBB1652683.1 hypothetical protein [Delftia sp. UME58]MBL8354630.1 OB-fold domain-containing protein [Delftia acidovorans]
MSDSPPNPSSALRPCPVPTPETQHFWNMARQGLFLVPRCRDCGRAHWYPRAACPFCWSVHIDWNPSPGRGTVYSFTVLRHGAGAAAPPVVLAFVTLDEGPVMLTHLVARAPEDWSIGDAVQVRLEPSDGDYPVPVFEPLRT